MPSSSIRRSLGRSPTPGIRYSPRFMTLSSVLSVTASYREPDHAAQLLVPQRVTKRADGSTQRQHRGGLQFGQSVVTLFQPVIRNAGAEVVDMVKADIAAEPLKDARQPQMRGAG